MWQSNSRMSLSFVESKGLLNEPGDNNCFLNSAVQVLWHLDVFRRSFRLLTGHMCMGNACIFCALKVIFTQFQYSDQSALPPDALRKALAKNFKGQQRFQLGLMDDAAECFENILIRIHGHITSGVADDNCKAPHCISHQKFTQTLLEQVICACGAKSEPHVFNQMVHYVATNVLCAEKVKLCSGSVSDLSPQLFTHLLKTASTLGDTRKCPNNCGRQSHILKTLTNCPEVISVGLIWNSDRPTQKVIQQVIHSIGTRLLLSELYESVKVPVPQEEFHLVGVVCYYGKHYSTFFYHSKRNTWISFDDANVKEMGSWSQVADKCTRGHYQPLLLLYASPVSDPVSTDTALQKTTMLTGHSFSNESVLRSGNDHHRQGSGSSVERTLHPGGQNQAAPCKAEWGVYQSDEEGEGNNKEGGAHFRQSSYLSAMEAMAKQEQGTNQTASAQQALGQANNSLPSSQQAWPSQQAHNDHQNQSLSKHTALPSNYTNQTSHYNGGRPAESTQHWPSNTDMQIRKEPVNNNMIIDSAGYTSSPPYNQKMENSTLNLSQGYPPPNQTASHHTDRAQPHPIHHTQQGYPAYPTQHTEHISGIQSASQAEEEVAYIDRKAVERVLGLQGNKQPARHGAGLQSTGRSTQPQYVQNRDSTQQTNTGRRTQQPYVENTDSTQYNSTDRAAQPQYVQNRDSTQHKTGRLPQPQYIQDRDLQHNIIDRPAHQSYVHNTDHTQHNTGRPAQHDNTKHINYQHSSNNTGRYTDSTQNISSNQSRYSTQYSSIAQNSTGNTGRSSQQQYTPNTDSTLHNTNRQGQQQYAPHIDYQSSGNTAGDRSSASSSSSSLLERLIRSSSNPQALQLPDYPAPIQPAVVDKRFSSEESLSSASAGSIGTVKAHGKNYSTLSRSQESLAIIEDSTQPVRDLIQKMEPPVEKAVIGVRGGPATESAEDSSLKKADTLMEMCAHKEQTRDYAAALVHCQQAIGTLQQLVSQPDLRESVRGLGRVKYRACVERSRALHLRVQTCRQESVTSTTSNSSQEANSSTSTGYKRYMDTDTMQSAAPGVTSKTLEFPKPPGFNVVDSMATEDFPAYVPLSQRRKFMSDYVSREDYFSHHPRPPQKAAGKPSKPLVPPKPGAKPFLKHSMSTENETHPGHAGAPGNDESINIYATLPRRPKNRERSATLTGSDVASAYRACVEQQAAVSQPQGTKTSTNHKPTPTSKPQGQRVNSRGPVNSQTAQNGQVNNVPNMNVVTNGQVDNWSVPNTQTHIDHSLASVSNMCNKRTITDKEILNHTNVPSKQIQSEGRSFPMKQIQTNGNGVPQSSQYLGQSESSEAKCQQLVEDKNKWNLVSHKRQWSKEEIRDLLVKDYYDRTESGQHGSQPSLENMVNEQMQTLTLHSSRSSHKPPQTSHNQVPTVQPPSSQQVRGASSIQRVPPQQCVPKPDTVIPNSSHHPNVTLRPRGGVPPPEPFSRLEAHQLALQHRPSTLPADEEREKPGVERTHDPVGVPVSVELTEDLPPPPPELLEPLATQPHSLDSYVVPGLKGIVDCSKISFAPVVTEPPPRSHGERYRRDKDLADFCVVSKKECDPYNDLSSSSGIERTDTQSDTSSVSTANSRNSRTSRGSNKPPALVKKRRHKPRKSVTFSDNVMLIARARDDGEEVAEEPNYLEYVQKLLKRSPVKSEQGTESAPSKRDPAGYHHSNSKSDAKTGYDSDFDEDTTDSCTSDEVCASDKVQCNLCRKKLIHASFIYCVDCSAYMAQFTPSQ